MRKGEEDKGGRRQRRTRDDDDEDIRQDRTMRKSRAVEDRRIKNK